MKSVHVDLAKNINTVVEDYKSVFCFFWWWPWFESHKRHIPFQGTALLLSYKA